MLTLLGKDIALAKEKLNCPQRTFSTAKEAKHYICSYPLDRFMGITISKHRDFCCPFHNDHSPSASIHQATGTGDYLLTCNGACKQTWDIIGVVQRKYNLSYSEAMERLTQAFNIHILQAEEYTAQHVMQLEANLSLLSTLAKYPTTYRILTTGYPVMAPMHILQHLTQYAIELHQNKQILYDLAGRPIFYISVRELLRRLTGNANSVVSGKHSGKLTLLCYLGFLERVSDCEMPAEALTKANSPEFDYRKGSPDRFQNSKGNRIAFYRIPILNEEQLKRIEIITAQNWSRWYTISNISYNKILLTEGTAMADKIYAGRSVRHKLTLNPVPPS